DLGVEVGHQHQIGGQAPHAVAVGGLLVDTALQHGDRLVLLAVGVAQRLGVERAAGDVGDEAGQVVVVAGLQIAAAAQVHKVDGGVGPDDAELQVQSGGAGLRRLYGGRDALAVGPVH